MSAGAGALKVGVMGAGAVGCYLGGRLLAADAASVTFVGRASVGDPLKERGLLVNDFGGETARVPPERIVFATSPDALEACDVVLCCVKSRQTDETGRALGEALPATTMVVSMQNGLENADVLRRHLVKDRVLAGIVGFNVVWAEDGAFRRATSGPLTVEESRDARWRACASAFRKAGVELVEREDIRADQWTKLLLNLNNAVSALSGAPTQRLILDGAYRRIVAAVMAEGFFVARAAGVEPAPMKRIPMGVMTKLLRLPTPLVRVLARAQMRVDPAARSSMWEDLSRRRLTEVDFLNGAIVRHAEQAGVDAPLNRRVVELVREAEAAGRGPPNLNAEELWRRLTA